MWQKMVTKVQENKNNLNNGTNVIFVTIKLVAHASCIEPSQPPLRLYNEENLVWLIGYIEPLQPIVGLSNEENLNGWLDISNLYNLHLDYPMKKILHGWLDIVNWIML